MQVGALIVDSSGIVRWSEPRARMLVPSNEQCVDRHLSELLELSADNRVRLSEFLGARSDAELTLLQIVEDNVALIARLQAADRDCARPAAVPQYRCQVSIRDDTMAERTGMAVVQLRTTVQSIMAGFAHEVRNPLAAILSIAEAAMQEAAEMPSLYGDLARIPALVSRVEALIRHAHDYSKPSLPKKKQIFSVYLINEALEILGSRYRHIEIEKCIDESQPPVFVDSGQIERTLINLLDNAMYAARSKVKVVARRARLHALSFIVIDIIDDGQGIPEDIQRRIFEPFFTTKAKGTGLGLALARDLARINGGELRLRASNEEGTVFRLLLPIRRESPSERAS